MMDEPGSPPLVSICIPVYNAAPFVAATLDSALAQDYPRLVIIVSDDRSTDHTPDLVQGFAHRGVRLLRQPNHLGMYANWNAVIRASRGKYVCKLDHDDLLAQSYLSSLVPVLEAHPRIVFAHCACRLIDAAGIFRGYERSIHGSFIRPGLQEWPRYVFGARAVNIILIRRSAYDAVGGYDEQIGIGGDWKMQRELLTVGDVFYHDGLLASYRIHGIGKAGREVLKAQDYLRQMADMHRNWPAGVPDRPRLLNRARRAFAVAVALSAAQADPAEARVILQYLPGYAPGFTARMIAHLVQGGGAGLIRTCLRLKTRLRQLAKGRLYRPPAGAGKYHGSR